MQASDLETTTTICRCDIMEKGHLDEAAGNVRGSHLLLRVDCKNLVLVYREL